MPEITKIMYVGCASLSASYAGELFEEPLRDLLHVGVALAEPRQGILQDLGPEHLLKGQLHIVKVPVELKHVRVELVQVLHKVRVRLQLLFLQKGIDVLQHVHHIV